MKKRITSIAILCILSISLVSCGSKTEKEKDNSTTTPEQQAALYGCPMRCEGDKTYDAPGKCPVCGMDLKPAETTSPEAPDSVSSTVDSVAAV